MKTTIKVLLFILLFAVSCSNDQSDSDLLNDPEEQDEVLTFYGHDEEYDAGPNEGHESGRRQ